MRNLKRALSLTLASVMLLGMMVVGSSAATSFPDVDDKDNIEAIEVLEKVGVLVGNEKHEFEPDKNVTRAEMAVIMAKLLGLDYTYYNTESVFTDVPSWAVPYVNACYASGIVAGRGEGIYDPNGDIKAVEAAAMMMRALGYFQSTEDNIGGFETATVRQASAINLFAGINGNARTPLNRNQVAQLALNTLEANMVYFTGDPGFEVNGVKVGYRSEYTFRTSAEPKYAAISRQGNTVGLDGNLAQGQYYVQLGEELYNGNLRKSDYSDEFDRPATRWELVTNKGTQQIGVYANAPAYESWDRVGSLNSMIGSLADNATWEVYYNGQYLGDAFNGSTNKSARGVLTQAYLDTTNFAKPKVTVSMIDTYLAEVMRVSTSRDTDSITLNYLTSTANTNVQGRQTSISLKNSGLVVGDKVLVNLYETAPNSGSFNVYTKTLELAGVESGIVTGVKSYYYQDGTAGTYAEMDGNQYKYVDKRSFARDLAETRLDDPTLNVENTLYLDTQGNLIGFEASERDVQYLYVEDIVSDLNGARASVVFANGVRSTIYVSKYHDFTSADSDGRHYTTYEKRAVIGGGSDLAEHTKGVFAYVENGTSYELRQLQDSNDQYPSPANDNMINVWKNGPTSGGSDDGVSSVKTSSSNAAPSTETKVGSADTSYGGKAISYSIRNGRNAIEAFTSTNVGGTSGDTRNVVSLSNNTIFVDTEGGVVYVGYNNVPTMADINFFVVYNRQYTADVVFVTKGADNSTSDNYFYVIDSTPFTTREEAGTLLRTWRTWVNGEQVDTVLRGITRDVQGNEITQYALYRIVTVNPKGEVTACERVTDMKLTHQAGRYVPTYRDSGTSGTIRVANDGKLFGTGWNDVVNYEDEVTYTYDKDTIFMVLSSSGSARLGSVADINTNNNTVDRIPGHSNVYVVSVADPTVRTPKATLVYVVNQPESYFAEYNLTVSIDANVKEYKVGTLATQTESHTFENVLKGEYKLTVTPKDNYKVASVTVDGNPVAANSDGTYTVNLDRNRRVVVTTAITYDYQGTLEVILDDKDGRDGRTGKEWIMNVYHEGENEPDLSQIIEAIVSKVEKTKGVSFVPTDTVYAGDLITLKFLDRNNVPLYAKYDSSTGLGTRETLSGNVSETALKNALDNNDKVILTGKSDLGTNGVARGKQLVVENGGELTLGGGSIAGTITGSGAVIIDGDVGDAQLIQTTGPITLKANGSLSQVGTHDNPANVIFDGNSLAGKTMTVAGDVTLAQDTTIEDDTSLEVTQVNVPAGKKLTIESGSTFRPGAVDVKATGKIVVDTTTWTATSDLLFDVGRHTIYANGRTYTWDSNFGIEFALLIAVQAGLMTQA